MRGYIQRPGIDGWVAARGMRARLGAAPLVVALTANAHAHDAPLLETVGFDGFIQKPLRFRELQALLERAHERSLMAPPPSEFDAERWRELGAVQVDGGASLLERMQERVLGALPETRCRLLAAHESATQDPQQGRAELGRALHDLHGLLSLIGATRAAASVGQAEQSVQHGELSASAWHDVQQHVDTVSAELSRILGARTA